MFKRRLPKEKKTLKVRKLTSCMNFRMIQDQLNVLKDQQLRELRRIRTTCPAVYLYDNVNKIAVEKEGEKEEKISQQGVFVFGHPSKY